MVRSSAYLQMSLGDLRLRAFLRSGNTIGPDGSTALAADLEQLTALQDLNLRCQ
jgi:hypothetical protein